VVIVSVCILAALADEIVDQDNEDTGTCSMEKPTCGEPLEDKEDKEKKEYKKIQWTNDEDYEVRHSLDKADDILGLQPLEAIEIYEEVLKDHPESPRANYALARSLQVIIMNQTTPEESKKQMCGRVFELCRKIMDIPKERMAELMRAATVVFMSGMAEGLCEDRGVGIEATYFKLEDEPEALTVHQQNALVYDLYLESRWDEALTQINNTLTRFNQTIHLLLIKGVIMRINSDDKSVKKQVNKLLLDVDMDHLDQETKSRILVDLDHIGVNLGKKGRDQEREMLFQFCSKVHLTPSRYQRSFDLNDKVSSRPVWNKDQLKPRNRWTSAESLAKPNQILDRMKEAEASWETVRDEAVSLAGNVTEEDWISNTFLVKEGGGWKHLPVYLWGKRKHAVCEGAPTTCKLVKKIHKRSQVQEMHSKVLNFGARNSCSESCRTH